MSAAADNSWYALTPARAAFTTVRVEAAAGQWLEVSGQPTVCPYLAITPCVQILPSGEAVFEGSRLCLIHTPSGRRLAVADTSEALLDLSRRLSWFDGTALDPGRLADPANEGIVESLRELLRQWRIDEASADHLPTGYSTDDFHTHQARRKAPATTFLREQLDSWLRRSRESSQGDTDAPSDPESGVDGYGLIYLLAVLQRVDPGVADVAATQLVRAVSAAHSVSVGERCVRELLWRKVVRWSDELAKGQPLTLPAIPDTQCLDAFVTGCTGEM